MLSSLVAKRFGSIAGASAAAGASILSLLCAAAPASATPTNLVQNGSFETSSATSTQNGTTIGSNANNLNLPGWQINGCPGTASTCGYQFVATSNYATNGIYNAISNQTITFDSAPGPSPDGGNAFVSDASYQTEALYQTIGNLKVGDTYVVQFDQASMQQTGFSGASADRWAVGLANGGDLGTIQYSDTMNNPSQGSTGWVQETMSFVASATSQSLFFFATANQGASPPFLLLDGVSMTDSSTVPEPASLSLAAIGLAGVIIARRRRGAKTA